MVTASHDPPSDNAVKVYWSTGGQILPPHDKGIIQRVMTTQVIRRANFDEMLAGGKIAPCQDEIDAKYQEAVLTQATKGPRDLNVIYSPLHGVGATAVIPVLAADGFDDVEVSGRLRHRTATFPTCPAMWRTRKIRRSSTHRGARANLRRRLRSGHRSRLRPHRLRRAPSVWWGSSARRWSTLTGNQIGALLADFVLENRRANGQVSPQHFIVQTLVTTQLIRLIGDSYGVRTIGDLLVGFKWIAGAIDEFGPERFIYGTEESHGYMAGHVRRDKDGAVASMLLCELAAKLKAAGQTLHEKLDALFWQHGVHVERTISVQMPGSEGMIRMQEVMAAFRAVPPTEIAGERVVQIATTNGRRHAHRRRRNPHLDRKGDLVILDLAAEGNYVACRPSGTEPKSNSTCSRTRRRNNWQISN